MARTIVCKISEVSTGQLTPARIGRTSIVLSRLPSGEVRAFVGRCPHQGAELSAGCVAGAPVSDCPNELAIERHAEVIRCPWHGFEWDMKSGLPLVSEPEAGPLRLHFYRVEIVGDDVVVTT
jgi:nitrite reductase/ring-hydroxylating ferredoxin subunit